MILILGLVAILAVILPYMPLRYWWTRIGIYPRQQLLVLIPLIIVCSLAIFGQNGAWTLIYLGALTICMLICVANIIPFTGFVPTADGFAEKSDHDATIAIFLLNVLQDNRNFAGVLDQIRELGPDIVFLCETDETWDERLRGLSGYYPFSYKLPSSNYNGLIFYSKFELLEGTENYFSQDYIPSLDLLLKTGAGTVFRCFGLHPRPPRPEDAVSHLDRELGTVCGIAAEESRPSIVLGDLNEVGWSPVIKRFLKKTGFVDPRRGRGVINTYHAKIPFVRWPLDHVLHSRHFYCLSIERLKSCGSDHFPLLVKLRLPAENAFQVD